VNAAAGVTLKQHMNRLAAFYRAVHVRASGPTLKNVYSKNIEGMLTEHHGLERAH
jgi:hypothetical protein